jgi:hypothetical protein
MIRLAVSLPIHQTTRLARLVLRDKLCIREAPTLQVLPRTRFTALSPTLQQHLHWWNRSAPSKYNGSIKFNSSTAVPYFKFRGCTTSFCCVTVLINLTSQHLYRNIQVFWNMAVCHWASGSRRSTSRLTDPTTRCHIPEDLNTKRPRCENHNNPTYNVKRQINRCCDVQHMKTVPQQRNGKSH